MSSVGPARQHPVHKINALPGYLQKIPWPQQTLVNPMPGHLFEGNPVGEGTKRRGTDTPMHLLETPAGSTHSLSRALRPPERLKRQAEFRYSDKTRPDSPVPTLQGPCGRSPKRRESLRFQPSLEVRPSSVAQDPAESRVPANSTGCLASQKHPGKFPKFSGRRRGKRVFPAAP